jgi:hypothetical protein
MEAFMGLIINRHMLNCYDVPCRSTGAYHLSMTTIHPECPDIDASDLLEAADVLLRQEPDEEDDEEGDDRKKKDDDDNDDTSDGYSE